MASFFGDCVISEATDKEVQPTDSEVILRRTQSFEHDEKYVKNINIIIIIFFNLFCKYILTQKILIISIHYQKKNVRAQN